MPSRARPPLLRGCTGVLVAGGQALRLGGLPKGLLRVGSPPGEPDTEPGTEPGTEPILARSLRLFDALFDETLVVANDAAPYQRFGARIVPDLVEGKGAPGGLHAALAAARTEWVFTAACDMPFLSEAPIAALAAERAGVEAVAVIWRGRLEPLHAFWSRGCFAAVDRLVRAGDPSMWQLATAVGARFVPEERWRVVDPEGRAFANANTPEDLARLGLQAPP